MKHQELSQPWRPVLLCMAGILGVALVTLAARQLQADSATVALLYLLR